MSSIAIDAKDGVSIEKIFWAELHGTWLNHESNSPDTKSCVRNQSLPMRAKSQQPQNITTKTSLTTLNPKRIISLALKAWKEARPTVCLIRAFAIQKKLHLFFSQFSPSALIMPSCKDDISVTTQHQKTNGDVY